MKAIRGSIDKESVVKLYNDGLNCSEIALQLGGSVANIHQSLKRWGVPLKTKTELRQKYIIDDTVFEKIDSAEKAYWLGFLFADGYNSGKDVKLVLHIKDINVIEAFREFLCTDKPIRIETRTNGRQYAKFVIENRKMVDDLTRLGCVRAKTHTLVFPELPDELKRHFILGYFDGDGCFSTQHLSFVGRRTFLEEICHNMFLANAATKCGWNKRHKTHNDDIWTLQFWRKNDLIKISDYFYKNPPTFYLKRKKNKIDEYLCNTANERVGL